MREQLTWGDLGLLRLPPFPKGFASPADEIWGVAGDSGLNPP